jgi:hypothetical protein
MLPRRPSWRHAALVLLGLGLLSPQVRAADPIWRDAVLSLMSRGTQISRTVAEGENLLLPRWEVPGWDIRYVAQQNFERAAAYVVDHYADLPVNLATAIFLNKMLTKDLVPEKNLGEVGFRQNGKNPHAFYHWLESPAALRIGHTHPDLLAHLVHHNIGMLDSFPDGNGRLARLMADLALLRRGRAPALYEDRRSYFASFGLSPAARRACFMERARNGQRALEARLRHLTPQPAVTLSGRWRPTSAIERPAASKNKIR